MIVPSPYIVEPGGTLQICAIDWARQPTPEESNVTALLGHEHAGIVFPSDWARLEELELPQPISDRQSAARPVTSTRRLITRSQ